MEFTVKMEFQRSKLYNHISRLSKLAKWFVAKYITKKPFLMRVEYHVVDHCNLNCQGCAHFSNISPERFRKVEDFEADIACLAAKMDLEELVIIGGEPLLHPDIASFLSIARRHYKKCSISLCTNCLLLSKMTDEFWDSMRKNKIGIKLTIYPPMKKNCEEIIRLVQRQRVKITHIQIADYFGVAMNRNGDSDPRMMHKHCSRRICHHLRDGRLYTCPDACYMDLFNAYFQQEIPRDAGIDIYQNSGRTLERYVTTYKDMCRYCSTKYRTFRWAQSKKVVDEWDGEVQQCESRSE